MPVIRFASTVILLRETAQNAMSPIQTYTIKRPDTMKFLPGYTVFPGGAVDEGDMSEVWKEFIQQDVQKCPLLPAQNPSSPLPIDHKPLQNKETAHVVAAIREVFEETGALICQVGPEYLTPQYLSTYRKAMEKGETTFFEIIKTLQIKLDTRQLLEIGSRLTPPGRPARFYTNFYITFVPKDIKMIPSADEVTSDAWIDPSQAEEMWERQEIFCVTPTKESFRLLAQPNHQRQLLNYFT